MVSKIEQTVNSLLLAIADAKRLPVDFLLRFARPYDDGSLLIRYGAAYRPRYRGAAAAKHGSLWATSGKAGQRPIGPYGPGVGKYKGSVRIVVEGESDCWALWLHSFPAMGVPGATMAHVLAPEHFADVNRVYVHREPDAAGEAFVAGVAKRLRKIGYAGEILWFACGQWKDPAELHVAIADDGQGGFRDEFEALLEVAVPVDEPQQATSGGKHQHGGQCGCGGCQGHATHQHAASGGKLDIEAVRRQLELVDLRALIAGDLGPQAKGGKWHCPFHDDCNNPNLTVSPNGQRWVCWACGAKGDAIDWLRERHGMSFLAAAAELGIQLPLGGWIDDDYMPEWVEATDADKRWDGVMEAAFGGGNGADVSSGINKENIEYDEERHQPPDLPEYSVHDCHRCGGVVQRHSEDDRRYRIVYGPCRSADGGKCQACRHTWEVRHWAWYRYCLLNEPQPLYAIRENRAKWKTLYKRMQRTAKAAGVAFRYVAIEDEPNTLFIVTTAPLADAEPIGAEEAASQVEQAVCNARAVIRPVLDCPDWKLPTKERVPDGEWVTTNRRFTRRSHEQMREVWRFLKQAGTRPDEGSISEDDKTKRYGRVATALWMRFDIPRRWSSDSEAVKEAAFHAYLDDLLGVKPPDGEGGPT